MAAEWTVHLGKVTRASHHFPRLLAPRYIAVSRLIFVTDHYTVCLTGCWQLSQYVRSVCAASKTEFCPVLNRHTCKQFLTGQQTHKP